MKKSFLAIIAYYKSVRLIWRCKCINGFFELESLESYGAIWIGPPPNW